MTNVEIAPMMHPQRAPEGVLAAMHLAWKSSAAMFPTPKIKMVAQFQKMALGLQTRKEIHYLAPKH